MLLEGYEPVSTKLTERPQRYDGGRVEIAFANQEIRIEDGRDSNYRQTLTWEEACNIYPKVWNFESCFESIKSRKSFRMIF
jgi:hypothetical protein